MITLIKKNTVLPTFLYRGVIFACVDHLSFFSASVRHFERGVDPGNDVGV